MKKLKKLLPLAISIFILASCGGSTTGTQGPKGDKGDQGEVGPKGETGVSITKVEKTSSEGNKDTYTIYFSDGTTSTFFITNGQDGLDGSTVSTGNGEPAASLGKNNDSYIDLNTWDYFLKENGTWNKKGNIKGEQGIPGVDGSSLHNGHGMPSSTLGKDKDSYINLDNWDYYVKNEDVWVKTGNISYTRKYTVRFMYGDEEIDSPQEVEPNSRINIPKVTQYQGQEIDYWYVNGYEDRPWVFTGYYADRVVDPVILYAKLKDYELTLDVGEGGVVTPTTVSVNVNKPYSLPIPTTTAKRYGYSLVFDYWTVDGERIPNSGDSWIYGKPSSNSVVAVYTYGDDYTESLYNLSSSGNAYQIDKVKDITRTGTYIVPKSYKGLPITTIAQNSFTGSSLSEVSIGESVKEIKEQAFRSCSLLKSLHIPSGVTTIGNCITHSCNSLEEITVDSNNSKYDSRNNCNAIIETSTNTLIQGCISTIIPNSVAVLDYKCFTNIKNLTSIEIPSSVKTINDCVFMDCTNLKSIYIPKSVLTMKADVFSFCESLTIDCEAPSKPEGWDDCWNSERPVNWGVIRNN